MDSMIGKYILFTGLFFVYIIISSIKGKKDNHPQAQNIIRSSISKRKCYRCGTTTNLQEHHLRPLSLGGQDIPSNIIILCKNCHEDEHGYSFEDNDLYRSNSERSRNRSKKLLMIENALTHQEKIRINYTTKNFETKEVESTDRIIIPKEIYTRDRKTYVRAYCFLRKAERNFRLSKIVKVKPME